MVWNYEESRFFNNNLILTQLPNKSNIITNYRKTFELQKMGIHVIFGTHFFGAVSRVDNYSELTRSTQRSRKENGNFFLTASEKR